ncbi:MAG: L(+)-tartrate dehydratase subunit alpha [Deltaproteobacteria bacterium]|jgi:L(+)-tartrate dehydratase alpha subunit|nr:L(+)-tartrate dehydratase subunit alpha [Deltaproteobacteria bacterium]
MLSKNSSVDSVIASRNTVDGSIPKELIYEVALELMSRAAIGIPGDFKNGIKNMCALEKSPLSKFVLNEIQKNYEIAEKDQRPMCGDTGLPRWYVKLGNDCRTNGGFVELERNLRRATADATQSIPLRPNRVHPLTRKDNNNNLGIHAPEVQFAFEPEGDWLDLTTVHKGGLFGTDYRMLFPADGIAGIKKFFLDTMVQFGRRGMACQPAVVGIGIGGCKDTTMRIAKEAACLRAVGDRNPDPEIAELELELKELGNSIGMGPMGFVGSQMVVDTHIEVAYAHTGGMQTAIHTFCFASRRASARIWPDGQVEFRTNPQWFTDYYRREGI